MKLNSSYIVKEFNFTNCEFSSSPQVSDDEVSKLVSSSLQPMQGLFPEFDKFSFCPRTIPDSDSVMAMLGMFEDLGMISRWRIARDSLARFVLLVKRGYR